MLYFYKMPIAPGLRTAIEAGSTSRALRDIVMSMAPSHQCRARAGSDQAHLRQLRPVLALLEHVSRACATAETPDDAISACLELVARFTGWPIAHAYRRRESDGALRSMKNWYMATSAKHGVAQAFIAISERLVFEPGMDLVGQVAAQSRPVTCDNVVVRPGFMRAAAARASGVRGCFAFPILVEGTVEVVLEFFSHASAELDGDLLELMGVVAERLAGSETDVIPSAGRPDPSKSLIPSSGSEPDERMRGVGGKRSALSAADINPASCNPSPRGTRSRREPSTGPRTKHAARSTARMA